MKFRDTHRIEIIKLLDSLGYNKKEYQFSKRKGRIIIEFSNQGKSFSFYQTKDFDIDIETMNRIDLSKFEVVKDREQKDFFQSWSDVLNELSQFAKALKSS